MEIDKSTEAFAALRSHSPNIESEEWTETDTRSKFIDTVLIDCLGWSEKDIRRELSGDRKRLDYLLSIARPIAVIEAKKSGHLFPLSSQREVTRVHLGKFMQANPVIQEPITQLVSYCHNWSAPLAVLTNGRSYIVFVGARTDGIPWKQGDAIVVQDIFGAKFNFSDLYNLLAKNQVANGSLTATILADRTPAPPKNVLSEYASPNATIPKNPIGLALEPLLRQVFSDVTRDDSPDVIRNCYVLPGETTLRDQEFEALLLDHAPRFAGAVVTVASANAFSRFEQSITDSLERRDWAQTLLVIGGVGVGKTMFLQRFFRLRAGDHAPQDTTCAFFIDFRKPELDPKQVPSLVYRRLREQVLELDGHTVPGEKEGVAYDFVTEEGLLQVFWPQMQRFLRGPESKLKDVDEKEFQKAKIAHLSKLRSDDREFVRGALRVLRERYHRRVCVILDNADQTPAEYQEAVYLFSRTLEDELRCLIVVALREEWYWHFGARGGGPLSAYHDVVYHIPAPRARDVLAKRLEYAISLGKDYRLPSVSAALPGNMVLEAAQLSKYLDICHRAFLQDDDITVFYECVANGSVRKGLDVFLEFVRSGHTHVNEYLKALMAGGSYVLRFHQVFKPVALGSYAYYSSRRSMIPNLYAPTQESGTAQLYYFARAYFLNWLGRQSKATSQAGEGFVPIANAKAFLLDLGLGDVGAVNSLRELVRVDLVEPDIRMLSAFNEWGFLRITALGLYTLRRLSSDFAYLEAIMLDTPLTDEVLRRRIAAIYIEGKKPLLSQRLVCVQDFLVYMRKEESLEQVRIQSAGLATLCPPVMPAIEEAVQVEFQRIKEVLRVTPATTEYGD